MEEPFRLKAKSLVVPVRQKDSTVMMVADKYVMEIKILPESSTDLWPPIPLLNKSEGSLNPEASRRVFGNMEGYLVTNYLNLPLAPADDVPLSVSFDRGGRTYKTKYGFQVSSSWTAGPSPLAKNVKKEGQVAPTAWYQKEATESVSSKPKSKSKPTEKVAKDTSKKPHMNDTVHVKPKTTVCYIFEPLMPRIEATIPGFQSCRVEGYWCPMCRTEFYTLRQLHFHLSSSHPKFSFCVDKEERAEDSNLPARVTIRVDEAEIIRERASDHVKDPREMSWKAPNKPLDVDAYLNGDHQWFGGPHRKKKVPKPPSEKKIVNTWGLPDFRHPDDVPDLPHQAHSKHPVPRPKTASQTPFYKSVSHQIVEAGETLSESDDEIDQSWLKQKHRVMLTEHRKEWFENDTQRRLRIAFDEHLMDERFPNTRYISDSFVRFLRKMEDEEWMWEDQGRVEIYKLCAEMMRDGLMNEVVLFGITAMVNKRNVNSERETSPCIEDSELSIANNSPQLALKRTPLKVMPTKQDHLASTGAETGNGNPSYDPDMYGTCSICHTFISRRKQITTCSKVVSSI